MENVTLKYIMLIARCESIEYSFFCAASVLTFFVGYDKSLKMTCNRQNNT